MGGGLSVEEKQRITDINESVNKLTNSYVSVNEKLSQAIKELPNSSYINNKLTGLDNGISPIIKYQGNDVSLLSNYPESGVSENNTLWYSKPELNYFLTGKSDGKIKPGPYVDQISLEQKYASLDYAQNTFSKKTDVENYYNSLNSGIIDVRSDSVKAMNTATEANTNSLSALSKVNNISGTYINNPVNDQNGAVCVGGTVCNAQTFPASYQYLGKTLIQWGNVSGPNGLIGPSDKDYALDFPKPFLSTNYSITITPQLDGTQFYTQIRSNQRVRIYNTNGTKNSGFFWFAIGQGIS